VSIGFLNYLTYQTFGKALYLLARLFLLEAPFR